MLAACYPDTLKLYQGELHAHAQTLPDKIGDDGTTNLSIWLQQMNNLDLDFAASLDHKQTSHYKNASAGWDTSQFVYGTEASTTITDRKDQTMLGNMHYNMLFPDKDGLDYIIEQYEFKSFSKIGLDQWSDILKQDYEYGYRNFTKKEFADLIKSVREKGGFFIHAHPTQTEYSNPDNYLDDYYFADYAGFEVFYINTPEMATMKEKYPNYEQYGAYGTPETTRHYEVWNRLLKAGKRLYATSGSDTHGNLNNYALTSIYSTEEADADKGAMIAQLVAGNFVAGAVGIQMCIDTTPMGGYLNYTDTSRLVVNVGEFHFSEYVDSTHKYRVDVITEDGIAYSRQLIFDGNGVVPTNGKFAMNVDSTSEYYRVEVVDRTSGCRIAIGQPIWNGESTNQ